MFPVWLREDTPGTDASGARRPNRSPAAGRYLERLDLTVEDLFHHVLAVLHDPAYRQANAGALRMEWPRIPLPGWPELSAPAPSGRGASRSAQFPAAWEIRQASLPPAVRAALEPPYVRTGARGRSNPGRLRRSGA